MKPKKKENKPTWLAKFKDFPEIPPLKRWEGSTNTEQVIVSKLLHNKSITENEENQLREVISFYKQLISKINLFDISLLNKEERKSYLCYLNYAFTHKALIKNNLNASRLIRAVINKNVIGKNERIDKVKYLSYPPRSVVKKSQKYNRANTPYYNVFYATSSYNSALLEIKPSIGDLVTICEWSSKLASTNLTCYPITFNQNAIRINKEAERGFSYYEKAVKKNSHPVLSEWLEVLFGFISDEFAKPVSSHFEYFYSSYFSKKIFDGKDEDWGYDCILYPSVANRLEWDNLAVRPSVIDQKFAISKVSEFKIKETFFDRQYQEDRIFNIDVVEFEEYSESIEFKNGDIIW